MPFSNYVAYFDESGDHGLTNIDPAFPVFVLCGCVFRKDRFLRQDLPNFTEIKFNHFGHDSVIFHSREIRKKVGPFQILTNIATHTQFVADLSNFYRGSSVTIIAAGIDKAKLSKKYRYPDDPYQIALLFCLERLHAYLADIGEGGGTLTCVFEKRGTAEDARLAQTFGQICSGHNQRGVLPFQAVFADKLTNMAGLQIADLAAYPIARQIINPRAANPAYAAIDPRFRRSTSGKLLGYGLKVFP